MDFLLLQTGDYLLLQTGDKLILAGGQSLGSGGSGARLKRKEHFNISEDDQEIMEIIRNVMNQLN